MASELLVALRLSKAGYGTVNQILMMPTHHVLAAIEYEKFLNDYEAKFIELNKQK